MNTYVCCSCGFALLLKNRTFEVKLFIICVNSFAGFGLNIMSMKIPLRNDFNYILLKIKDLVSTSFFYCTDKLFLAQASEKLQNQKIQ